MLVMLTDSTLPNEDFLEYVNAILSTGEIPGLFQKEERDLICAELREAAKSYLQTHLLSQQPPGFEQNQDTFASALVSASSSSSSSSSSQSSSSSPDNAPASSSTAENDCIWDFFVGRFRDNCHLVLCFSPMNSQFRTRARRFPSVFSVTTIDWFLKWPADALQLVASRLVTNNSDFRLECDVALKRSLEVHMSSVHEIMSAACTEYTRQFRRGVFVTPKSFISYLSTFRSLYGKKEHELGVTEERYRTGLQKLAEAEEEVTRLNEGLQQNRRQLAETEKKVNATLIELNTSREQVS